MPRVWLPPMLLTPAKELPEGSEWFYEEKKDGYRCQGRIDSDGARLRSRNRTNFTDDYPEVVHDLPSAFLGHTALLDGEIVGHNYEGEPRFQALKKKQSRAVYYIFDLLELDGTLLIDQPLSERRRLLSGILVPQNHVNSTDMFSERDLVVKAARDMHLEGVVAKNLTSRYAPGQRNKNWLKMRFPEYPTSFGRP